MVEEYRKTLRNFGLAMAIICLIVGTRFYFKFHNVNFLFITGLGIILAVSGLTAPNILKPVHFVFNKVGRFIFGKVITNLVLMIAYYGVFTPIGLFAKIAGKDLAGLKIDKKAGSYWVKRDKTPIDPKQYEKQY